MKIELTFVIFSLFPGWLFSYIYLLDIHSRSREQNIKFISAHTIMAVVFSSTLVLIFCVFSFLKDYYFTSSSILPPNIKIFLIVGIMIYLLSFVIAYGVGDILRKKRYKYEKLIPTSEWDYIFENSNEGLFYVTVLVDSVEKNILYVGILDNYTIKDGDIENIILVQPFRRFIDNEDSNDNKENKEFGERFYKVDVDRLLIKCENAQNIGVKFIEVEAE